MVGAVPLIGAPVRPIPAGAAPARAPCHAPSGNPAGIRQPFLPARPGSPDQFLGRILNFQGPFREAFSRENCPASLPTDPPDGPEEPCAFTVLAALEKEVEVAIFRHDRKPGVTPLMAQWVRFRGDKIAEILLFFDSGPSA